jgi:hypothetical protein
VLPHFPLQVVRLLARALLERAVGPLAHLRALVSRGRRLGGGGLRRGDPRLQIRDLAAQTIEIVPVGRIARAERKQCAGNRQGSAPGFVPMAVSPLTVLFSLRGR